MANDAGGGGAGGSYLPPPPPPSGGSIIGGAGGGWGGYGSPPPAGGMGTGSLDTLLNYTPPPQVPDYNALMNQYMAPYQDMVNQQLAMLQEQMSKQSGFAQDEYGINSDIASGQHKDALREIINMLASRGMLDSGDKKWRTSKENTRYNQQASLLKLALNRYLYGLQASYQNASMSANSGLAAQRAQIGWQLPQMYPPTPSSPPFAWNGNR